MNEHGETTDVPVLPPPSIWARKAAGLLSGISDLGMRMVMRELYEERVAVCLAEADMDLDTSEQVAYDGLRRDLSQRPDLVQAAPTISNGKGDWVVVNGAVVPRGWDAKEWAKELRRRAEALPLGRARDATTYLLWADRLEGNGA